MIKVSMISKIQKYNPKWKSQLFDFLNSKIDHLTSSSNDEDFDESDSLDLDMNKDSKCVVGELWNFDFPKCYDCETFGMILYHRNSAATKQDFANALEKFYTHVKFAHPELISKESLKEKRIRNKIYGDIAGE